eukprot:3002187-Prymnesium_polylepis.1
MGLFNSTLDHQPGIGGDGATRAPDAGSRWHRLHDVNMQSLLQPRNHDCNLAAAPRVKVGVHLPILIPNINGQLIYSDELGARHSYR